MFKIVFLYAEMVPSWMPTFKKLVEKNVELHVVHSTKIKKTPYKPEEIDGVNYYDRSKFNQKQLNSVVNDISPDLIFISGWQDNGYLLTANRARKKKVPVVSGFDNWWLGTPKQRLASYIPRFIRQSFISHAWIPGPRQYEYVKRLGFQDHEIIHNLLTCDVDFFVDKKDKNLNESLNQFLYIGRFSIEKGIDTLVSGYQKYLERFNGTWSLLCIGNGPLDHILKDCNDIDVLPFTHPNELRNYLNNAGAFILPSNRDFSPLVVHEAVCAGKPLILSDNVGNMPTFGINKFNCLIFETGSCDSLAEIFHQMENMDPNSRRNLGENSIKLSYRNTPEVCAASLLSIIS